MAPPHSYARRVEIALERLDVQTGMETVHALCRAVFFDQLLANLLSSKLDRFGKELLDGSGKLVDCKFFEAYWLWTCTSQSNGGTPEPLVTKERNDECW